MLTAESVKSLGKALLAAHEKNKSEVSPATLLHAPRPCLGGQVPYTRGVTRTLRRCPGPTERRAPPRQSGRVTSRVLTSPRRTRVATFLRPYLPSIQECLKLLKDLEHSVKPTEELLKVRWSRFCCASKRMTS